LIGDLFGDWGDFNRESTISNQQVIKNQRSQIKNDSLHAQRLDRVHGGRSASRQDPGGERNS
jgi:hypothetical protein